MYELAIEHQRSGLSLSIHPDRRDAGEALAAYAARADCLDRVMQLTDSYSSYELVDPSDGRTTAIATIEHRPASPIS